MDKVPYLHNLSVACNATLINRWNVWTVLSTFAGVAIVARESRFRYNRADLDCFALRVWRNRRYG